MKKFFSALLLGLLIFTLSATPIMAAVPTGEALRGTVKIDGVAEEVWNYAKSFDVNAVKGGEDSGAKISAKLLWDNEYLYAFYTVKDANVNSTKEFNYEFDSIELYVDEDNSKNAYDKKNDSQNRIMAVPGETKITTCTIGDITVDITAFVTLTDVGYNAEISYKFIDVAPKAGAVIGVDFQCNDDKDANGTRDACYGFSDTEDKGWQTTAVFADITLSATEAASLAPATAAPATADTATIILVLSTGALALCLLIIAKKRVK